MSIFYALLFPCKRCAKVYLDCQGSAPQLINSHRIRDRSMWQRALNAVEHMNITANMFPIFIFQSKLAWHAVWLSKQQLVFIERKRHNRRGEVIIFLQLWKTVKCNYQVLSGLTYVFGWNHHNLNHSQASCFPLFGLFVLIIQSSECAEAWKISCLTLSKKL